jgi:hypothetical protein
MRSIYITVILIFLSEIVVAQISEIKTESPDWILYGQVKYVGPAKASLQFIPHETDSTFLLLLWDQRPELKNYFSIRFSSRSNTVEQLYEVLLSFFEKGNSRDKQEIRRFQLGTEQVSIYRSPTIGTQAIILSTQKGRIELRKGEIKKLFRKE